MACQGLRVLPPGLDCVGLGYRWGSALGKEALLSSLIQSLTPWGMRRELWLNMHLSNFFRAMCWPLYICCIMGVKLGDPQRRLEESCFWDTNHQISSPNQRDPGHCPSPTWWKTGGLFLGESKTESLEHRIPGKFKTEVHHTENTVFKWTWTWGLRPQPACTTWLPEESQAIACQAGQ